jgi:hypothetical protein
MNVLWVLGKGMRPNELKGRVKDNDGWENKKGRCKGFGKRRWRRRQKGRRGRRQTHTPFLTHTPMARGTEGPSHVRRFVTAPFCSLAPYLTAQPELPASDFDEITANEERISIKERRQLAEGNNY